MQKAISWKKPLLFLFILFVGLQCQESIFSLDNAFVVSGNVSDFQQKPLEAVAVEIMKVDASDGHPAYGAIGHQETSQADGVFSIGVGAGTSWKKKAGGKTEFTHFVRSLTLRFSKTGFVADTLTVTATNLKETFFPDVVVRLKEKS